ncbi:MAG: hypothetical protein MI743_18555 [Sneathiellales bacterium]|nr:hypothetical protein [Sneathiellales bacterium]
MQKFMPSSIRKIALASAPLAFTLLSSWTAQAAPQILAVASTDIPLPLTCEKGECTAELTAICLQEHRASPQTGAKYYIHQSQRLKLTLIDKKGHEVDISALPLDVSAARGHTAIRVSLKETLIRDFDMSRITISVPEKTTAIPVAVAHDKKPQTDADILIATQSLRPLANRIVDQNTDRADAARLVSHAINSLPSRGRAEPSDRLDAQQYFQSVSHASGYSSDARRLAAKAVRQCDYETKVGFWSLRQCLGSSHDQLIGKLNTKYWKSLKAGS